MIRLPTHFRWQSAVLTFAAQGLVSCGGATSESTDAAAKVESETNSDAPVDRSEAAGAACLIQTSNYDRSCSVDSDCIAVVSIGNRMFSVQSGNYCEPMCLCGGGVISSSAEAQYVVDVSKTPFGSGSIDGLLCYCPNEPSIPSCMSGSCSLGYDFMPADAQATSDSEAAAPQMGDVLCGLESGPIDGGEGGSQPSRWCMPPESCVPFNGGWACCTTQPFGGMSVCVAPVASEGGT
jgi:hypothetical protein